MRAYLGTEAGGRSGERPMQRTGALERPRTLTCDLTSRAVAAPVVRDVTLEVPAGEVTALLGPNGAGKSSLVLAVGGVLRPQSRVGRARRPRPHAARPEQIRAGRRRDRARGPPPAAASSPSRTTSRVATYALSATGRAGRTRRARSSCSPSSRSAAGPARLALGRRAADGRARAGARLAAAVHRHRRALARPRAGRRPAPDPDDPVARRSRASACS